MNITKRHFEVTETHVLDVDGLDDYQPRGSGRTFRPTRVAIAVDVSPGSVRHVYAVTLQGPQVLTGGGLGRRVVCEKVYRYRGRECSGIPAPVLAVIEDIERGDA